MHILEHSDTKLVIQYRPYIPLAVRGTSCLVGLLMLVTAIANLQVWPYALLSIAVTVLGGIGCGLTDVVTCTAYSERQMVIVDKTCLLRRRKFRFHIKRIRKIELLGNRKQGYRLMLRLKSQRALRLMSGPRLFCDLIATSGRTLSEFIDVPFREDQDNYWENDFFAGEWRNEIR